MLPTKFWWQPCLLTNRDGMCNLQRTFHRCFLPNFGSFSQAVSEEKIFKNRTIRNKNCLWWPCLLTDRDEMSNFHRGHSIDASYQVSVVAMFVNRSGRNEQSSEDIPQMIPTKFWWQPCLLTDRDEMSNLHRRHSIDASYQVSVVAMFVNRWGRNKQSSQRTFHRCFLPNFGSFG